jgi:peptidoglycan/LPS O-acetylase OafA/YrhL
MGLVRTLLALTVILSHTIGHYLVGGQLAVELFFIISGFLMSYILVEDQRYTSKLDFYLSRAFRIYPVYWVVAATKLAMWVFVCYTADNRFFFDLYRNLDPLGAGALVLSNLFIFGQDWIMFTGVQGGEFQFLAVPSSTELPVRNGLLVPPAWSLGVELSFYIVAPWLLRRQSWLLGVMLASAAIELALLARGLGHTDPWAVCFFPADIVYFLAGALSHQKLRPLYQALPAARLATLSRWGTVLILAFCAVFSFLPGLGLKTVLMMAVFIVCLPLLFEFQRHFPLDSAIGNLSYPLYICHNMLLAPAKSLTLKLTGGRDDALITTLIVLIASVLLSLFLERVVADRVDHYRRRFRSRTKATRSSRALPAGTMSP